MQIRSSLLVLTAGLILAGCRKPNDTAPSAPKRFRGSIGISVLTETNPFFKVIAQSMAEEAAKYGYEVISASGENDVARQQNQVKDFIVNKVSAIALSPCDSKAIGPVIVEANRAGIPVFTMDIACLAPEAKVISHIATDNYGGGRLAAQAMIEGLGGRGKVAIIDYPEVESVIQRTRGFEDEIAEANKRPGVSIEIVAKLPGGGARDGGRKAAQDLLQSHPDMNGIFAINDPSALGARVAIEEARRADQVVIIGFDGQPDGKQAIKEGKIYADPIQFPEEIGRKTVQAIMRHFNGEELDPQILIRTVLYRKADAEKDPTVK